MEWYLGKAGLISETEWIKAIDSLLSNNLLIDKQEAKQLIRAALITAVEQRIPDDKFAILFSGGIDSVLMARLCKDLKKDFLCYTVGFYDVNQKYPEDLEWAEKVAEHMGLKHKKIILSLKESEKVIKKTASILGKELSNVVNVGVGSVLVAVLEKEKKIKYFFSGLGSEELFAGYERHAVAKDINEECIAGLKAMYTRDLLRDSALARHYKINLLTPFLDQELIRTAMQLPAEWKLSKEQNKIIIRELAEDLGIRKEVAWRKKRAAQYGSRMNKALDKLANKKKLRKKEYLQGLFWTIK